MPSRVANAVRKCAWYSVSVFLTYASSATIGGIMAHAGSRLALSQRDAIVGRAADDRITVEYRAGRRVRAALADAAANFGMAALPQTIAGFTVVLPYVTVARQGWIGGIVSVNSRHESRLRTARGAAYYLGVLLLQFLAYSLCIGGGIRCGVDLYRHNQDVSWRVWRYRFPRATLVDLFWVVVASMPLFLVASAFEFLSTWNI